MADQAKPLCCCVSHVCDSSDSCRRCCLLWLGSGTDLATLRLSKHVRVHAPGHHQRQSCLHPDETGCRAVPPCTRTVQARSHDEQRIKHVATNSFELSLSPLEAWRLFHSFWNANVICLVREFAGVTVWRSIFTVFHHNDNSAH